MTFSETSNSSGIQRPACDDTTRKVRAEGADGVPSGGIPGQVQCCTVLVAPKVLLSHTDPT
jgi:hypothetical protein